MGKISRSLSKSLFLGLVLAGAIALTTQPANAQLGVTLCSDVPDTETITDVMTLTNNNLLTQLEDDTFSLETTLDSDEGTLEGTLTALLTKLDMDISALGTTNTNNAATGSMVAGKAADAQAQTQYTLMQQQAQAKEQVESATGAGAYQRNNLCQQVSLQAGRSSIKNGMLSEFTAYNTYRASGQTPSYYQGVTNNTQSSISTCGGNLCGSPSPAGVVSSNFTKQPLAQRLVLWAKSATAFFGTAENSSGVDGVTWANNPVNQAGALKDSNGNPVTDDTIVTHLDVDPMSLSWLTDTYSVTEQKAHDQLSNYLVGIPADIISSATSFTGGQNITPQYASAVVASRERIAFQQLTAQAMAQERAYHDEITTGASTSADSVYKSAGLPSPVYNNGISLKAVDEAMYNAPADDPNFAVNLAGMNTKPLLEFIATEMTYLNSIEYRRYLQEVEMYKVQSAALNLQVRTFNFAQNP